MTWEESAGIFRTVIDAILRGHAQIIVGVTNNFIELLA